MYATNQQTPMYSNMNPYHWNHPLRVSSHDRITVSNHPNDSHWYSDSVLCHTGPTVSSHHTQPLLPQPPMKHEVNSKSNYGGLTSTPISGTNGPRAVIPSKRAAQNRAAQRAFRQRKERYVKDLEKKAKQMDEWKMELDQLRRQNQELRENTLRLEKQIHQQKHPILSPMHSPCVKSEVIPAPVVMVMGEHYPYQQEKKTSPKSSTNYSHTDSMTKVVYHSPTTSYSSSSSSSVVEDQTRLHHYQHPMSWNSTTSGSDFEQANNYDFIHTQQQENEGQALDDLCTALQQSRQRTDTTFMQQENYVMLSSSMTSRNDNHTMLMSRTY